MSNNGGNGAAIRVFVVRAIDRCNGQPIPQETLADAVRLAFPHLRAPADLLGTALRDLETSGHLAQGTQDLTGDTLWALTDRGRITAAQLR